MNAPPAGEFEDRLKEMIERAQAALNRAIHYNDFKVGCCMLVTTADGEYKFYEGANRKPEADGYKSCAELGAINSANADGCVHVVGIVVIGPLRAEDVGVHNTLHPCEGCRGVLANVPQVNNDTIVYTQLPDGSASERFTFGELLEIHKHGRE